MNLIDMSCYDKRIQCKENYKAHTTYTLSKHKKFHYLRIISYAMPWLSSGQVPVKQG